jgi:glycolate oxidase FAD binding subunit
MTQGNVTATTLRPSDLRSLRDAVLDTAGPIAVAGAGTAAGWAGPLAPVDTVLDTTGLTGVIVHNPGDMTVAVRSGMPLRELIDELAPQRQRVAFDAARVADGATVGGLIATGDAGPAALVFGSLRDLVIGITMVLADGTVARSGGHVIKNVAGYDLARLLHGSYGAFGVIAEVVLRLHPRPERAATLVIPCPLDEAAQHATAVLGGPYEPAALEWISGPDDGPGGRLLVRIECAEGAMGARVQRLRSALGTGELWDGPQRPPLQGPEGAWPDSHGRDPDPSGGEQPARPPGASQSAVRSTEPAADDDPWAEHARLVRGTPDLAVLRIGVRPSRLPDVLAQLPTRTVTAGLGTGVATVTLPAEAVADAHARVHTAGGTSVLRARPADPDTPAWGPPPSAVGVLQALKSELDPQGRFGPGRFAPWF